MAFYISLAEDEIARQIAILLNLHNKLKKSHNEYTIMNNGTDYFIEVVNNKVIGCVGLINKEHETYSRIKHVCVVPEYRKMGIAKKLIKTAILNCTTKYVYVTIRRDNTESINLWHSLKFKIIEQISKHSPVLTMGRKTDNA